MAYFEMAFALGAGWYLGNKAGALVLGIFGELLEWIGGKR